MCDSPGQDFLTGNVENSKEISLFEVECKDSGLCDIAASSAQSSPSSLGDQENDVLCFSAEDDGDKPSTPIKSSFIGKKKRLFASPEAKSPSSQAVCTLKRLRINDGVTSDGGPQIQDNGPVESSALLSPVALVPSLEERKNIVKNAVEKSCTEEDLIGDFTRSYTLPVIPGSHPDLKCISVQTMKDLLEGNFADAIDSFRVIDSRYPYEFEGGHIKGAENLYTKDDYMKLLEGPQKKNILIFHCEFSKERGPAMARQLRKADRTKNAMSYPSLDYPEIYILEGGYKQFFLEFPEHCDPMKYTEMLHPNHTEDLRFFRKKCRSTDDVKSTRRTVTKSRPVRKYLSNDYF